MQKESLLILKIILTVAQDHLNACVKSNQIAFGQGISMKERFPSPFKKRIMQCQIVPVCKTLSIQITDKIL